MEDRDRQVRFWTNDEDYLWFGLEAKKRRMKQAKLFRIMKELYVKYSQPSTKDSFRSSSVSKPRLIRILILSLIMFYL
mgnify:CR=1 FL=1